MRISGPKAHEIAERIFRSNGRKPSVCPAGTFFHGYINSGDDSQPDLDEVILMVFRAPHSYTREDVVEIQSHGGRICARRILRAVLDAGARPAEPGEFTKRAFLNGRIDLLQAEAVLDLIQANSDRAASAAVEQLEGRLTYCFADIYDALMSVASDLEATLDFSDQDLPETVLPDISDRLADCTRSLTGILQSWEEGHVLREGVQLVITGKANVGKSTLMNKLLQYDRAIVTNIPGTTRDILEENVIIDGVQFRLFDTAGIRTSDCDIEKEGISRARSLLSRADVILYMIDSSQPPDAEELSELSGLDPSRTILVLNKQDIAAGRISGLPALPTVKTSLTGNIGLEELREALTAKTDSLCSGPPHAVISERHRHCIQSVLNIITEANALLSSQRDDAVAPAASLLRESLEQLGTITGKNYTEELLDNIFSKFCIGK